MARPKLIIDWLKVEKLATTGATGVAISKILGIDESTLRKRCARDCKISFSEYMKQKKEIGFSTIRMKQYQVALGGNPAMLIWLGKQYLRQTDKGMLEDRATNKDNLDLSKLTKEELTVLQRLVSKAEMDQES